MAVLSFSIIREVSETFDLIKFMHQFPWYNAETDEDKLGKRAGFLYKKLKTIEAAVPMTGITPFQLVCAYFMMSIKFALGCALLYVSSAYIVHADSNENMILNSVAMLFIIDVDELLYAIIVPDYIRRMIDSIPPVVAHPKDWQWDNDKSGRETSGVWKMHSKFWTGVATTGIMWWSWCRTTYGVYDIQHGVSLGAWAGAVCLTWCCIMPCCILCVWCVSNLCNETVDNDKDVAERIKGELGEDSQESGEDA